MTDPSQINAPIASEKPSISLDQIRQEKDKILKKIKSREPQNLHGVNQILDELLKQAKSINFRTYCKLKTEKDKIQKKHFLLATIETLIDLANKNNFSLCRKNELIFLYNGQFWEHVQEERFKDFLGDYCLGIGVDRFDANNHLFKDELLKQFKSTARLSEIEPNTETTLINLLNGTFEISHNKTRIREYRSEDFLTYQLPFSFNPDDQAPLFKKFLNRVIPDIELQNLLAEYVGYIFVKNAVLKLEKVLILYGTGANGKSVIFDILTALIGSQNITNYSLQSLTNENGYNRAMLSNKLLNYASEINGKLESSYFKLLASGEPVEARLPHGKPQIIKDYARFVFNCNDLPKEVENTHAFFRRFIIIPFKVTIPEREQDKNLAKKIIENELAGIFNWVLEGVHRILKNQEFTDSKMAQEEISKYKRESDSVLLFLDEEDYEPSINSSLLLKELYGEFRTFCSENGHRTPSTKTFSQRLQRNGYHSSRISAGKQVFIQKKDFVLPDISSTFDTNAPLPI